ncbi:MAG: orotate phosphoribosyltransferase [Chloroflexi bacterium]|nr:orotate phosphoribosyltransferase [Chloroflexota bacterium]
MNEEIALQVSQVLLDVGAVVFRPENPITFKSGIQSPVYIDNRILPFHPDRWQIIINGFKDIIREDHMKFDVIAGVATSGIAHAAALAYSLHIPCVYIRKEEKEHGTRSRIEKGNVHGRRVVLLEDMVTTGGSSLSGVEVLREEGAIVTDCLAIATYGFDATYEAFQSSGVQLHPLTDFASLWRTAKQYVTLTLPILRAVDEWLQNPQDWLNDVEQI